MREGEDDGGMVGRFPYMLYGDKNAEFKLEQMLATVIVRVRRLWEDVHHVRLGPG